MNRVSRRIQTTKGSKYSIALGTMLVLLASIGFGRFAYGAIVPLMARSLQLNSFQVGLVATGQNVCYMLFAWVGGRIVTRTGFRSLIVVSLGMCGVSTLFTGLATDFTTLLVVQSFAGGFSGLATIPSYGLIFAYFETGELGKGVGIVNGGPGLGLALTGVAVPLFSGYPTNFGWRFSWFFYGTITIAISAIVPLLLLSEKKKEENPIATNPKTNSKEKSILSEKRLIYICLIYFIFGLVYIIYVTYFPSFVNVQLGYDIQQTANAWKIVGFLAIFSGLVLGALSDKIGKLKAISFEYILLGVSPLIAIILRSLGGIYLSAFLFGVFLFGIPSVVITMAGSLTSAKRVPEAVGLITIFFGIGQALGPALAGYVSNLEHSYDYAFLLSSSLGFVGFLSSVVAGIYEKIRTKEKPTASTGQSN